MPDENNLEQDNQTNTKPDDSTNETDTTQVQTEEKDSKEGFFKSTIDYIKKSLKSGEADDSSSDEAASLSETNIPDDFSETAEKLGWTGEDIVEFASNGNKGKAFTDEELKAMVPEMLAQLEEDATDDTKQGDKQATKTETKSEVSDKDKDADKDANAELRAQLKEEILKELGLDNVQELKDSISQAKEEREFQTTTRIKNRADELFDDMSKEIPVFGLTKDLPVYPAGKNKGLPIQSSPAFKARSEVYGDAIVFMNAYDLPIDEAMRKAFAAYGGKNLKDETRRKVVKDLKAQEQNLSGSRTGKEVKKDYSTKREEDIDYIRQLQRATGQDV